jgi:hypothetical protein
MLAMDADFESAMRAANAAAAVVVGKRGTATLSVPELRSRILPAASLAPEEKIVFVSERGCSGVPSYRSMTEQRSPNAGKNRSSPGPSSCDCQPFSDFQSTPDLDSVLFDAQDCLARSVAEIDITLYIDPVSGRAGDLNVVGRGHDLGEKVGPLHGALSGFVVGTDNAQVRAGFAIARSEFDPWTLDGQAGAIVAGKRVGQAPFEVSRDAVMGDGWRCHHHGDTANKFPLFTGRADYPGRLGTLLRTSVREAMSISAHEGD